jgi:putative hydrolase of the HAD superfamily
MLDRLDVEPGDAVMVGDTIADDIEGAIAVGMQAVLLDREGRYPEYVGRLGDLRELPAALGIPQE